MEAAAPRIIAYTRVSTQGQVSNSSLATQRFVIEQYALNQEWHVDEIIQEVGSAYRSIPEQMRELARTLPNGSRILVSLVDRFSRNIEHGRLLLDLFHGKGVIVTETMRNQHSNTLVGQRHFDRQIQSAQDESEAKSLRAIGYSMFRHSDEYQEGSDYELSGGESDGESDIPSVYEDGEYLPGE